MKFTAFCSAQNIQQLSVTAGEDITLPCTVSSDYPKWTGPERYNGLTQAYNNPGQSSFPNPNVPQQKRSRLDWGSDKSSLIIRNVILNDKGLYQCSAVAKINLTVKVPPSSPVISNTESVNGTLIIRTSQSQETTLVCISSGGYPQSNVEWYRGNIGTQPLPSTSSVNSGTNSYTVTQTYRFTPQRQDDGVKFICQTSFQTAPRHIATTSAELLLNLMPNPPIVVQTSVVSAWNQAVIRCTTTGSRPAASITWSYRNTNHSGEETTVLDDITKTYRVVSLLKMQVTAEDNGQSVQCKITHTILVNQAQLTASVNLNVRFSVQESSTRLTGNREIQATGSTPLTLNCTTGSSNPASDIKWFNGSAEITNTLSYTTWIGENNGQIRSQQLVFYPTRYMDGDVIKCAVSNILNSQSPVLLTTTLNLRFKPLSTTITGDTNIISNGRNRVQLTCTSDNSNPVSDITWRNNSFITPATGNPTDINGNYGGKKRRVPLTFTPTRFNDGDVISCEAKNTLGTSEKSTKSLDLRYRPLISPISDITVVEGDNAVLICKASSKPVSTFKWYRGRSILLKEGIGTIGNNGLTFTMENVRRTDAATYTCNANNGVEIPGNKNVILTVQYPPHVKATTKNTTVLAERVVLFCIATGLPNISYTYGKWIQKWQGYDFPITENPGNERLVLKNLSYAHSGIYICSASNGIKVYGTNTKYISGSVQLLVKSFPLIVNLTKKRYVRLKEYATIEIVYFSNVDGSSVNIMRTNNDSLRPIYTVVQTDFEVKLPVFSHTINSAGFKAIVTIQVQLIDDLGLYDAVVSNEIGPSTRRFEIVVKGPPQEPRLLTVDSIQFNSARISWKRGYHGGAPQTFVIQVSSDLVNWDNVSVNGGLVESTERIYHVLLVEYPTTTYYVQMLSFNSEGSSPLTTRQQFTTLSRTGQKTFEKDNKTSIIIGGVLSLIIVAVVTYAIHVTVLLKRKGYHVGKDDKTEQDQRQMYVNIASSERETNERENKVTVIDSQNQYEKLHKYCREQEVPYDAVSSF